MIKNQQKIDFNFFWIVKKEREKSERKNEYDKNKESNKSAEKPNENKSEIKNGDNKSYNVNKSKENINKFNLNEKLINNNISKTIDLNKNDNYKKIKSDIFRNNDKYEKCKINLKNKIDEKSYINLHKNRSELFNKRILINPSKEQKLSRKLDAIIYKSPIATCIKKSKEFNNNKSLHYKTIKERQNSDYFNNLYKKYKSDFNKNNFNQIMLGSFSSNSIKKSRNIDDKTFRTITKNYICQSPNGNDNNYINLNSYNKPRDESFLIINNNTNYYKIKSFFIIDNNKRNGSISPNNYINSAILLKKQKNNNNNINKINSYRNIFQYY